jgi:hypothetical protein
MNVSGSRLSRYGDIVAGKTGLGGEDFVVRCSVASGPAALWAEAVPGAGRLTFVHAGRRHVC